ncbi:unnamed protein product [Calypogeia fissa]
MSRVARLFWLTFVDVAREFINQLAESDPKEYYRQLDIVHLVEVLYKYHTSYRELGTKHEEVTDRHQIADYFVTKQGDLKPIKEVLADLPISRYDLSGTGLLSPFVLCEVAGQKMDHNQIIEQEKASLVAAGLGLGPSTSKPRHLPKELQSRDKPRTQSSPKPTKEEAIASPPEQPAGSGEPVEDPRDIEAEQTGIDASALSDVSQPPGGVMDRLMDATDAMNEMQQGDPMEIQQSPGIAAIVEEQLATPQEEIQGAGGQELIDLDTPPRPTLAAKKKVALQVNYVPEGIIAAS